MQPVSKPSWLQNPDLWLPKAHYEAPQFSLPDNRFHVAVNKLKTISSMSLIGRAGITAVLDTNLEYPYRAEFSHGDMFGPVTGKSPVSSPYSSANLTQQDMINIANVIPLCPIYSNDFSEGPWGMPYWAPQLKWFYEALIARHTSTNVPALFFDTYGSNSSWQGRPWHFMTGGANLQPNSAIFKAKIASQAAARAESPYYFDNFYPMGIGILLGNYAIVPDYANTFYNHYFAAILNGKGMGKVGGMGPGLLGYLDWPKIEAADQGNHDLHNGYFYDRPIPGQGTVRTHAHPQIDYDWRVMNNFMIGFCLTNGVFPFDNPDQFGTNPGEMSAGQSNAAQWIAEGNAPAPITTNGFPTEPLRLSEAGMEAAYYYSLCNRTAGEPWLPCRYRFEGSETWIEPTGDETILEHASAFDGFYAIGQSVRRGRPVAHFRYKGNALDLAVCDPSWSKLHYSTIIINPLPNVTIQATIQGGTMQLFNTNA